MNATKCDEIPKPHSQKTIWNTYSHIGGPTMSIKATNYFFLMAFIGLFLQNSVHATPSATDSLVVPFAESDGQHNSLSMYVVTSGGDEIDATPLAALTWPVILGIIGSSTTNQVSWQNVVPCFVIKPNLGGIPPVTITYNCGIVDLDPMQPQNKSAEVVQ